MRSATHESTRITGHHRGRSIRSGPPPPGGIFKNTTPLFGSGSFMYSEHSVLPVGDVTPRAAFVQFSEIHKCVPIVPACFR